MMKLNLKPVRVATGSDDEEGRLAFHGDRLVGVLVRLSAEQQELAGRWFLEAGFGRLNEPAKPDFADLQEAKAWISRRLEGPRQG